MELRPRPFPALGVYPQRYRRVVIVDQPSEPVYALRRVQIFADDLLKMEILVWSEGDEQAVGLACKAAREVLRSLPKRPQNQQRYSNGQRGVVAGQPETTPEDYN